MNARVKEAGPEAPFDLEPFFVVDLETLGKSLNSSIVEIGIAYHDGMNVTAGGMYVTPDWSRAEQDTLRWWERQAAWGTLSEGMLDTTAAPEVSSALIALVQDLLDMGAPVNDRRTTWWALGTTFDISMLETQCLPGIIPWSYKSIRCMRNLFASFGRPDPVDSDWGHFPTKGPQAIKGPLPPHSAVGDALRQAQQIAYIFERVRPVDLATGAYPRQPR